MDYIHYNPVKHGYVTRVADWPHSTFHRYVKNGVYPEHWAGMPVGDGDEDFGESSNKTMTYKLYCDGQSHEP